MTQLLYVVVVSGCYVATPTTRYLLSTWTSYRHSCWPPLWLAVSHELAEAALALALPWSDLTVVVWVPGQSLQSLQSSASISGNIEESGLTEEWSQWEQWDDPTTVIAPVLAGLNPVWSKAPSLQTSPELSKFLFLFYQSGFDISAFIF